MRAALLMSDVDIAEHIKNYDQIWINSKKIKPGGKITTFNKYLKNNSFLIEDICYSIFEHYEHIKSIDIYNGENEIEISVNREELL